MLIVGGFKACCLSNQCSTIVRGNLCDNDRRDAQELIDSLSMIGQMFDLDSESNQNATR